MTNGPPHVGTAASKSTTESVKPGRYRHYRGKDYEVFFVARHSETLEDFVVYRQLHEPFGYWIRPKKMFLGFVIVNGKKIPRFRYVRPLG